MPTEAIAHSSRDSGAPSPVEPSSYATQIVEKYRVRPGCPKCGMHMIAINDVSLVPDKRTYECLRCGNVSEARDLRNRSPSAAYA